MVTIAMVEIRAKRVSDSFIFHFHFCFFVLLILNHFIVLEWTFDEMQQFSKVSNSTVIAVEWGFKGLSCYGYIQITLCLISKIADFFAHWLNQCVNIEKLEMIGHSMGAQLVGYISQNLASRGRLTNKIVGLDPG